MSADAEYDVTIDDLFATVENEADFDAASESDDGSVITGDGSAFSTMSLDESDVHCMDNHPDAQVFRHVTTTTYHNPPTDHAPTPTTTSITKPSSTITMNHFPTVLRTMVSLTHFQTAVATPQSNN